MVPGQLVDFVYINIILVQCDLPHFPVFLGQAVQVANEIADVRQHEAQEIHYHFLPDVAFTIYEICDFRRCTLLAFLVDYRETFVFQHLPEWCSHELQIILIAVAEQLIPILQSLLVRIMQLHCLSCIIVHICLT